MSWMWYVLKDAGNPEQSRIVVPASMGGSGVVEDEDEDDIDFFTMNDSPSYTMNKCMHQHQLLLTLRFACSRRMLIVIVFLLQFIIQLLPILF